MIIDENKRFIFIHNPRTGGTSIRKALSKYENTSGRNIRKNLKQKQKKAGININKIMFWHVNHSGMSMLKKVIPNIQEYNYTFACVRNPYERTYSYYNKTVKLLKQKNIDLNEYIDIMYEHHKHKTYEMLQIFPYSFWTKGVDEVIRFEDLRNPKCWDDLMVKCGMQETITRPHENRYYISNQNEYRDYYSDTARKQISEIFEEAIETYKYEF